MRSLRNKDLFTFVRMVKNAGISDEIKKLVLSINNLKDVNVESFGYDILFTVFEAAADNNNEQAVYEFLSGPFEMTTEEIADMDLTDTYEALNKIADVEKWKSFFSSAAKLTK